MSNYWEALHTLPGQAEGTCPNVESHLLFVDPPLASYWIEHCQYKHQRPLRPHHVQRLATAITRGDFETSEVNMYDWGEGPKCINGWHRFHAIVTAGRGVWLSVTLHTAVTEAEVRAAYRRYDVGMMRGISEILRAAEIGPDLDISTATALRINSAAGLIYYRFDEPYWRRSRQDFRDYEVVLDRIRQWAREGREYSRAISMSRGGLRRSLWTRAVMAVALLTYRHQPDKAPVFWEDVACNSGLKRGEAAHTLVNFLADLTHERSQANYRMRAIATAWNAYVGGRTLQLIKVPDPDAPIRIDGTPFKGLDRKELEGADYALAPPEREAVAA